MIALHAVELFYDILQQAPMACEWILTPLNIPRSIVYSVGWLINVLLNSIY